MPEYLVIFCCVVAWLAGFVTCGAMIGAGPFWDGIRDGLTLRFLKDRKP